MVVTPPGEDVLQEAPVTPDEDLWDSILCGDVERLQRRLKERKAAVVDLVGAEGQCCQG